MIYDSVHRLPNEQKGRFTAIRKNMGAICLLAESHGEAFKLSSCSDLCVFFFAVGHTCSRWWCQIFFMFTPIWGR